MGGVEAFVFGVDDEGTVAAVTEGDVGVEEEAAVTGFVIGEVFPGVLDGDFGGVEIGKFGEDFGAVAFAESGV